MMKFDPRIWIYLPISVYLFCRVFVQWIGGRCIYKPKLTGKVIVISGGNTGIGFATCFRLAELGATLLIGMRSRARGEEAVRKLIQKTGNKEIYHFDLDLASLKQVAQFNAAIKEWLRAHPSLELYGVVANAGVMVCPWGLTKDGLEQTVGINHFGHFRMITGLYDVISRAPACRVVMLSSYAHAFAKLNPADLLFHSEKEYNRMRAYGNSKLLNLLFAHELNRRLTAQSSGGRAYSVHPGAVNTDLPRFMPKILRFLGAPLMKMVMKSPDEGAQTTLYCLLSPQCSASAHPSVCGKYFENCHLGKALHPKAYDDEFCARAWTTTEETIAKAMRG